MPPPWLFSPDNVETACRYYINYIRTRAFLRHLALEPGILSSSVHSSGLKVQEWREILNGNYRAAGQLGAGSVSEAVAALQTTLPAPKKDIVDRKAEKDVRPKKKQKRVGKAILGTMMSVEGEMDILRLRYCIWY